MGRTLSAATARTSSVAASAEASRSSPPLSRGPMRLASHVNPYAAGSVTAHPRAAPNVSAATNPATPATAPTRAERTGTAVRPRPGSNAIRTPVRTGGGAPSRANLPTTRPALAGADASRSRPAVRQADNEAPPDTRIATATNPSPRTSQSAAKPGSGSTRLANPTGTVTEARAARPAARPAPPTPTGPARPD